MRHVIEGRALYPDHPTLTTQTPHMLSCHHVRVVFSNESINTMYHVITDTYEQVTQRHLL